MTARTEAPIRTIEIRSGSVDVRLDDAGENVCLVFEARGADLRVFRTMSIDEATAFHAHLGARLTHTARSGGDGDSK